jgi:hypothetical protein|nr:MAG TPA: hypothetical protein [Caudoviricetes sp.]
MNPEQNERPSLMQSNYSDNKLDKSKELNERMSITQQAPDEYENKLHSIQGGNE